MMRASMDKSIPDLTLRLWTPAGARVAFVKQVAPTVEDLTHAASRRRKPDAANTRLGAWGHEERDYHIQVEVEPAAVGREKLAARVTVVAGDEVLGEGLVKAMWTTDTALSARISRPGRALHRPGGARASGSGRAGRTQERRHRHCDRKSAAAQWNSPWSRATTAQPSCSRRHRGRRAHGHRPAAPRCRRGRRDGARCAIDPNRARTEGGLMPTCAEGHVTEATDYCDVCGSPVQPRRRRSSPATPRDRARHAAHRSAVASVRRAATTRHCPHRSRQRQRRPMPRCRSNGPPSSPPIRSTTNASSPAAAPTPSSSPSSSRNAESRLYGNTLIGRTNRKQGVEPGIDLGIHPIDRGVSTQHAVLRIRDSGLTITDLGIDQRNQPQRQRRPPGKRRRDRTRRRRPHPRRRLDHDHGRPSPKRDAT